MVWQRRRSCQLAHPKLSFITSSRASLELASHVRGIDLPVVARIWGGHYDLGREKELTAQRPIISYLYLIEGPPRRLDKELPNGALAFSLFHQTLCVSSSLLRLRLIRGWRTNPTGGSLLLRQCSRIERVIGAASCNRTA